MPPPKLLGDTSSVWGHGCVRGVCRQPSEERSEENTVGLGDKSSVWATIKLNPPQTAFYTREISAVHSNDASLFMEIETQMTEES